MWYLVEEREPGTPDWTGQAPKHWLGGVNGGGRTIGRKHVDIRLKASSVSRTHARIAIVKAAFYSPSVLVGRRRHQSTCASVQDSSAYGTFLKYPAGHNSNRAENPAGHHRRLDKDTPTEVSEGAMLAFGAPSAWWRLGWEHIVLVPSGLTDEERGRLGTIAGVTGVEILGSWAEDATHLVASHCNASSQKFLAALVGGKHIVTPAWTEALHHTVKESCKAITEAATDDAATAASTPANEKRFIPPFSKANQAEFADEDLQRVFEDSVIEKRADLFGGIVFAFSREERRSRWTNVINKLGGSAVVAQALGATTQAGRIIFVQADPGSSRKPQDHTETANRPYISETTIVGAILRADLSSLDALAGLGKANAMDVVDVATPGPLDAESDAESDDTEQSDPVRGKKRHCDLAAGTDNAVASEAEPAIVNDAGKSWSYPQQNVVKKRVRASVSDCVQQEEKAKNLVAEDSHPIPPAVDRPIDKEPVPTNSDVNERKFFVMDGVAVAGPGKNDEVRSQKGAQHDVRPFRRRKLPRASKVPLKRVRYVERNETADFGGPSVRSDSRNPAGSAASGARVIESEEE